MHSRVRNSKRVSPNSSLLGKKRNSNRKGGANGSQNRGTVSPIAKQTAIRKESSLDEPILTARKHAEMMRLLDANGVGAENGSTNPA